VLESIA